jgi:hypothetical protein
MLSPRRGLKDGFSVLAFGPDPIAPFPLPLALEPDG